MPLTVEEIRAKINRGEPLTTEDLQVLSTVKYGGAAAQPLAAAGKPTAMPSLAKTNPLPAPAPESILPPITQQPAVSGLPSAAKVVGGRMPALTPYTPSTLDTEAAPKTDWWSLAMKIGAPLIGGLAGGKSGLRAGTQFATGVREQEAENTKLAQLAADRKAKQDEIALRRAELKAIQIGRAHV